MPPPLCSLGYRIVAAEVVLEQLVLEPVGVEAELVELAVQLRADRIAERDVLPGLAARTESSKNQYWSLNVVVPVLIISRHASLVAQYT